MWHFPSQYCHVTRHTSPIVTTNVTDHSWQGQLINESRGCWPDVDPNLETQDCKAISTFFRLVLAKIPKCFKDYFTLVLSLLGFSFTVTLILQAAPSLILFFEILSPCLILRYPERSLLLLPDTETPDYDCYCHGGSLLRLTFPL